MEYGGLLSAGQVFQDRPGGGDRQVHALTTKRLQSEDAVVGQQRVTGFVGMEGPGFNRGNFVTRPGTVVGRISPDWQLTGVRGKYFRGFDAFQLERDFLNEQLGGGELAGGDVHIGQSRPSFMLRHGGQVVVGLLVQECRFEHGSRGYNPDNLPVDQPL